MLSKTEDVLYFETLLQHFLICYREIKRRYLQIHCCRISLSVEMKCRCGQQLNIERMDLDCFDYGMMYFFWRLKHWNQKPQNYRIVHVCFLSNLCHLIQKYSTNHISYSFSRMYAVFILIHLTLIYHILVYKSVDVLDVQWSH